MKKYFKILGVVVLVIFVLYFLLWYWLAGKVERGELLKWEGKWYTKEQIAKKFGPQVYSVESKNTPEEVYTTFRQALLDGDLELAILQIREENREEYRDTFNDVVILKKYMSIPVVGEIKKAERDSYENFSSYYYMEEVNKEEKVFSIEFIKNKEGYWEIDSI